MTKKPEMRVPVWSWRDAIRKSAMSTAAKCLCYSIANYLNDAGGYAYPSVETLMSDMTCSNSTVARCVKEAVDAGYLHVQRVRNDQGHVYGTHYHPRFPECAVLAEPEAKPKISKPSQEVTLHDKSASRRKSLNDKSQRWNLQALDEDLTRLDDKSSRHNSPNNSPNNSTPLSPPSGGDVGSIFHGKPKERRRRRTVRTEEDKAVSRKLYDEAIAKERARREQEMANGRR